MRLACFLLLISLAGPGQAWESQFFPFNAGAGQYQAQTVNISGTAFRLPDFSYSGYKLSQVGLGDGIPCNSVTLTATTNEDIAPKLNQAVTTLAAIGGGTVYIPAGSFQIGSRVTITGDNLRIQGAGSSFTHLTVPASYTVPGSYDGIFYFTGNLSNIAQWILQSRCLTSTAATADIAMGSTSLQVANAGIFAPGDWVVVQQFFWSAFVTAASASTWPLPPFASQSEREFSFTYVRKVVSAAGTTLVLDAPVPRSLALANNSITVYKPNPIDYSENVGVEGFTLYTAARGTADATSIYWKGVFDGWARDVKLLNFGLHGFQPQWAARITILDCATDTAQYIGGGGQGYSYHVNASQGVLIRRSTSINVRHNITTQKALCSDVVFSRMDNSTATQQDDTHHSYAHNVLWDMHYQHGGVGLSATNRGTTSLNGYETFAGGVVWNQRGDGVTTGGWQAGRIQIRPDNTPAENRGFVIGNWGGHRVYDNSTDINSSYVVGTEMTGAAVQKGPRGNVAYEGINVSGLQPASLFEAQLSNRLGGLPPEIAPSACGTTPTHTPTRTATRTVTRTATPTPSATPSSATTATTTSTSTATPSPSATATRTNASSPTSSATASPSATPTATLSTTTSSTPSVTRTPAGSATSSSTGTPSQTAGPSATFTTTPTLSSTVSVTDTPQPSGTATASATVSAATTATLSATPTLTQTLAATGTATSTLTAGPSVTASPTFSASVSPSMSSTATPTPAGSFSSTVTATPSGTGTSSPTQTVTSSASPTNTRTMTEVSTALPSATATPLPSETATTVPTAMPSATVTGVVSGATAGPTALTDGTLQVLACVPVPNPDPQWLALRLNGPADDVEIRLYSPGMTLLAKLSSGPLPGGWSQVPLPAAWLTAAPRGLAFISVKAKRQQQQSLPLAPTRLFRTL